MSVVLSALPAVVVLYLAIVSFQVVSASIAAQFTGDY